jgi:hypothetical protein
MTLLSTVKSVCAFIGVPQPASVFSGVGSNRTMAEMLEHANEMATRIAADSRDWTVLKLTGQFTGDGATEGFSLPANFRRILMNGDLWRSTSAYFPMMFVPDLNEWMSRRAANFYDARGEWINYGGKIHIAPILATGQTVRFSYLDKNPVVLASPGGTFGEMFVADNDSFRLDERLLKLGIIWEWKKSKGSPYAEDMGTWEDAMGVAMGGDSPGPIIIGRQPISKFARTPYPFPIP